jgi:tetratricopeptide (TPR) repeat protein
LNRLILLLALILVACGGAYTDAIARGDKFAEAGQYDEAAAAYEQAIKIDPQEAEARIKLKEVRRKQAAERLQRAAALEQRGELANALTLVQDAVRFDPDNPDAQKALTRITEKVLDKAEELFNGDKLRQAFDLTTLVLKGAKNHPRARELDDRVRTKLAERSFERARALMEKDKLGNALVELAACITYRPDYPDAKLHFGQVKQKLEEQLRFSVVLEPFAGAGPNAAITKALSPELLQQSFDERLLLRVVTTKPAPDADLPGVLVRGEFSEYAYDHSQKTQSRSCDYQCGETYKPNPRVQELRDELARADQDAGRHDEDIARKERDLVDAEKSLMREQEEEQRRQSEYEQARSKLDECRSRAQPGQSSPCSSEESTVRSKQSSLDSARSNVAREREKAGRLREDIANRKSQKETARATRERVNQDLLKTPEQITVPKYCPHNYNVEQHAVQAKVVLKLTMDQLVAQKAIIAGEPFRYDAAARDETFPAQAGRCAEIAGGNPLQLPDEKALRKELMTKIVRDLRTKVVASYDAYRRGFLSAARRHEAAGLTEEATEAYVRYVLTGPHQLKDKKKLAEFFQKTSGIGKLDALWSL